MFFWVIHCRCTPFSLVICQWGLHVTWDKPLSGIAISAAWCHPMSKNALIWIQLKIIEHKRIYLWNSNLYICGVSGASRYTNGHGCSSWIISRLNDHSLQDQLKQSGSWHTWDPVYFPQELRHIWINHQQQYTTAWMYDALLSHIPMQNNTNENFQMHCKIITELVNIMTITHYDGTESTWVYYKYTLDEFSQAFPVEYIPKSF